VNHIPSYPSVFALGHKMIADLFTGPVVVQEKYDGSQFSAAILNGELCCRSKGKDQLIDAPDQMFKKAIAVIRELDLVPERIYRFEYISSPKHNTLAYARVPANFLVLFDIEDYGQRYALPMTVIDEARRIGVEPAITFLATLDPIKSMDELMGLLETESSLGGTQVEGMVVKNYAVFTDEKKIAIGKYVSERFKEIHSADWRKRNPTGKDVVQTLIEALKTPARWEKAVQHLRDADTLEGSPRDIGNLIREVKTDVLKEGEDFIKKELWRHYWPQIERGIVGGLPEWYKQQLAEQGFQDAAAGASDAMAAAEAEEQWLDQEAAAAFDAGMTGGVEP